MTKASVSPTRTARTILLAASMACATAMSGCLPAFAGDQFKVKLDEAVAVTIPAGVKTMILGNPAIADITLLRRGGKMVITGKSFGETNLVGLDIDGNLLLESSIVVSAPGGKLVIQRGMARNSYSCHPRCEPTISLGDDGPFMNDAIGLANARNGAAAPSGNPIATGK